MKKTTIAIYDETRKYLAEKGKKGETYDEIILKLINKTSVENKQNPPASRQGGFT